MSRRSRPLLRARKWQWGPLLGMALLLAAPARAEEQAGWPQWGRTPARNLVAAGVENLPVRWKGDEAVRWSAELGTASYGNPVVAGDYILVGTNNDHPRDKAITGDRGILMCFRAADGEFLWQDVHEKLPSGELDWPRQGICSSPAVVEDRVFYVTNRGEVIAADVAGFADGENDGPITDESLHGPHDADLVWRFDLRAELGVIPRFMTATHPLAVGDAIYLVTSNGTDGSGEKVAAPAAPSFIALDRRTGRLLWQQGNLVADPPGVRMEPILEGQWGSAAWGTTRDARGTERPALFFPGGDGWVYALEPERGELLWKFDCNPKDAVWRLGGRGTRNYLVGTPVFDAGRVYVGLGQDPEHGGGPGHLWAIDCRGEGDVTESAARWHRSGDEFGRTISTVAVHQGIVYAAELDGFLHAFDAESGEALWQHDMLSQIWGSPLVADGHVYLGDEDGDLVVLAAGRTLRVEAENRFDDAIYGTPIAVGRRLYIATRSRLYALESPER